MTKLTPQELDERIAELYKDSGATLARLNFTVDVELLLRDFAEAITPEKDLAWYSHIESSNIQTGMNKAIDTIQANTEELLGDLSTGS